MKRIFLVPLLLAAAAVWGKPAYRIVFQADGNNDSALVMGYYHAQNRMVLDTSRNNGRGRFVFEGERQLHPGLYFLTNGKDRYLEFAVYGEQPLFQFHTDNRNWVANMRVKGSKQNEVLFNYQRASNSLYEEMQAARAAMDSAAFAAGSTTGWTAWPGRSMRSTPRRWWPR